MIFLQWVDVTPRKLGEYFFYGGKRNFTWSWRLSERVETRPDCPRLHTARVVLTSNGVTLYTLDNGHQIIDPKEWIGLWSPMTIDEPIEQWRQLINTMEYFT